MLHINVIIYFSIFGIIKIIYFRNQKEMESPFIKKVKKILQDPQNFDAISWNLDKTMIQIRNQKIFEQRILSRHFRHNRISSFIRQLNLYGFKKIRSAQFRTFTHPYLESGQGLENIINKKKKWIKQNEQIFENESINILPAAQNRKIPCVQNQVCRKKQIVSDYRISQNPNINRQNQKEDMLIIATKNNISSPDQCLSTVWVFPSNNFQQNIWSVPYFENNQIILTNFNYNLFQNWC